jgi:hypothetical protein
MQKMYIFSLEWLEKIMYICILNIHQVSLFQNLFKNSKVELQERYKNNSLISQKDIGDVTSGE